MSNTKNPFAQGYTNGDSKGKINTPDDSGIAFGSASGAFLQGFHPFTSIMKWLWSMFTMAQNGTGNDVFLTKNNQLKELGSSGGAINNIGGKPALSRTLHSGLNGIAQPGQPIDNLNPNNYDVIIFDAATSGYFKLHNSTDGVNAPSEGTMITLITFNTNSTDGPTFLGNFHTGLTNFQMQGNSTITLMWSVNGNVGSWYPISAISVKYN